METKSKWQQALDEGAITHKEFIAELHRRVDEFYDKHEAEMAKAAEVQKPVVTKRKPARPQQIQPHA